MTTSVQSNAPTVATKTFNVIAIGIWSKLFRDLVIGELPREMLLRGYLTPAASTIEVDETAMTVLYNGNTYPFIAYSTGIHGVARTVEFQAECLHVVAYTDSPAPQSSVSSEWIIKAMNRRKSDPGSGY